MELRAKNVQEVSNQFSSLLEAAWAASNGRTCSRVTKIKKAYHRAMEMRGLSRFSQNRLEKKGLRADWL